MCLPHNMIAKMLLAIHLGEDIQIEDPLLRTLAHSFSCPCQQCVWAWQCSETWLKTERSTEDPHTCSLRQPAANPFVAYCWWHILTWDVVSTKYSFELALIPWSYLISPWFDVVDLSILYCFLLFFFFMINFNENLYVQDNTMNWFALTLLCFDDSGSYRFLSFLFAAMFLELKI